jgi:dihydroorotate dehydrogenase (fumarate)
MNVNLTTHYLRRQLKNPLVVSACPLTGSIASLRKLEAAGASAFVLQSLFAEQIEHDEHEIFRLYEYAGESSAESSSYFPELEQYNIGPEPHLEFLEDVKRETKLPVIASLNGTSPGKWVRFAKMFEMAGADALELNIYFVPTDPNQSAADVENQYVQIVDELARQITIPFAVKLGPYFSALPHFAKRLVQAGASGLVLFNRYLDPELDLETLRVQPHLALSTPSELRLVLRWLGILRDQLDCSLAATSGIHSSDDVVKALLAGANVTMMASALLRYGPDHLAKVLAGLEKWMVDHQYESVEQLIGSVSRCRSADASAFERANYMKALVAFTRTGQWS